jgi:ubiquinone/menaquinone biosynthesis C-methylase UbiE
MFQGFLDPEEILKNNLNLKEKMVIADFGCGSGGWVLPLAKNSPDSKIFAIDLQEEALSALRSKMKLQRVENIELVKADVEKSTRLKNESCDLVLMTNLLFEVEKKEEVFKEAKRVLKEGGRILVIDWKKEAEFGPEDKVDKEEVKKIAQKLGFFLEKEFEAGNYHWGLIFTKK